MHLFDLTEQGLAAAIEQGSWTQTELDERDDAGLTALMRAAVRGDYRTVAALKNCGANTDLTDDQGRKAVDLAALYGHATVIVYLIKGGCGG